MKDSKKLICIMGPTASGKTAVSLDLAVKLQTEIISADSVQIYRGMDIGSAKPDISERRGIKHHMIDCSDITERDYTVSSFRDDAFRCAEIVLSQGKIPIVVGGSGMYMSCFTSPLCFAVPSDSQIRKELESEYDDDPDMFFSKLSLIDPVSYARLHRNDKKRLVRAMEVYRISGRPFSSYGNDFFNESQSEPPFDTLKFGLNMDRAVLYDRIDSRVDEMISRGLIEEARAIYDKYTDRTLPAMLSIGYKQLFAYFDGYCSLGDAIDLIKRDTRRFAKRQMTWFNRDKEIRWFDPSKLTIDDIVNEMLIDIERKWK